MWIDLGVFFLSGVRSYVIVACVVTKSVLINHVAFRFQSSTVGTTRCLFININARDRLCVFELVVLCFQFFGSLTRDFHETRKPTVAVLFNFSLHQMCFHSCLILLLRLSTSTVKVESDIRLVSIAHVFMTLCLSGRYIPPVLSVIFPEDAIGPLLCRRL